MLPENSLPGTRNIQSIKICTEFIVVSDQDFGQNGVACLNETAQNQTFRQYPRLLPFNLIKLSHECSRHLKIETAHCDRSFRAACWPGFWSQPWDYLLRTWGQTIPTANAAVRQVSSAASSRILQKDAATQKAVAVQRKVKATAAKRRLSHPLFMQRANAARTHYINSY